MQSLPVDLHAEEYLHALHLLSVQVVLSNLLRFGSGNERRCCICNLQAVTAWHGLRISFIATWSFQTSKQAAQLKTKFRSIIFSNASL